MTYKEWLTTEAGMRWEKAIKSFVPDYSDLKAVVHITQDVFHASKNAVEAEMRTDDKVAAETARCIQIIQSYIGRTDWPTWEYCGDDGGQNWQVDHEASLGRIISEIRGAN